MSDLAAQARRWGIEPEYYDGLGRLHTASAETLSRLIAAISAGRDTPYDFDAGSAVPPLRAYQGDGRRLWAIAVQLYALRSHRNWGIGDFTDLAHLAQLAATHGVSAVGLNPLHALFLDRPEQASPYGPNSRLYLNPLYIDVEAVAEFPGVRAAGLEAEIGALRATDMVDYAGVARAKLKALHLAHQAFRASATPARRADFAAYRAEQGDTLRDFAVFETLRRLNAPKPWPQWPDEWRRHDAAVVAALRHQHDEECEFHEYLQWNADRQLVACQDTARRYGMPIGLYTDLAVGIDPCGADAWLAQDVVLSGFSVGAPPDEYNTIGQDWGLAPFNPHALPADDFAALRRTMAATMRHAGAIRIDHVLGLKRVFVIPHGARPADGAYVHFPFMMLLGAIAEESHRFKTIVIGEDLGTVPEGFRETLAAWGLWSCRLMLFEREGEGRFRAPGSYPAEALASFSSHDLPSYRGWLEGHDLRMKRSIDVDPGESHDARAHSQAALRTALDEHAPRYRSDEIAAVAAFLAATPSRLVVLALDDIMEVRDQINMPGTVDQHPNWRRRLPVAIEDLESHQGLKRVAQAFREAGRSF
jgi:4-alpha-glucanotransferase